MKLLVLGLGYSARAFVEAHRSRFSAIVGTARSAESVAELRAAGLAAMAFDGTAATPGLTAAVAEAEALLVSVPPGEAGDPALALLGPAIASSSRLGWIGYLSTVGVYGDHGGAWVDEASPCRPVTRRSRARLVAEEGWLALGRASGRRVQVFRLPGIYGPGRNALVTLAEGKAKRIVKPGQVFNRIHVADIAGALMAALERPSGPAILNVSDDEPAPPQDPVAHAAELLGVSPPPLEALETAALSPMALSFWGENKRVSNRLLKQGLGYSLRYPTYREGLAALLVEDAALIARLRGRS